MDLKVGDRVRHIKVPDWGLGQIVKFDGAYCAVFFVNKKDKNGYAEFKKDSLDILKKVEGENADHPLLNNLKPPDNNKDIKYRSIGDMVTLFLKIFPKGFYDKKYLEQERDYKIEAHDLMMNLLNKKSFDKMMKANEYEKICVNAMKVVNKTNLIFPNEKMSLKDGLKLSEHIEEFALSLLDLLYGNSELSVRFDKFADTLSHIKASKWTIQTYFLFITFPDKYMFMKPSVTQYAADAFAFELHYESQINWRSYETLLRFSHYVSEEISKINNNLKPRDMIDVQSFIWSSVPGKYSS